MRSHHSVNLSTNALLALTLSLLYLAAPAQADVDEALETMFYSAGTTPGAFETQTRMGIAGGAFSARTPIKPINLVSLDLPSISAGCGGIDIYGGSFSFISLDRFKETLRQIGANAAGYAFKIAITEMCKPCAATLASLQKLMTDLNSQFQNTCKIAKRLVDPLVPPGSAIEKQQEEASLTATTKNAFSDFFAAVEEAWSDPRKPVEEATENGADPDAVKMAGNLLWRALWRSQSTNAIGDPGGSLAPQFDWAIGEGIINLVGTYIIPSACEIEGGGPPPPGENCKETPIDPTLTFRDLRDGPAGTQEIWRCKDGDYEGEFACQEMEKRPFGWIGVRGYVHERLFGTFDLNIYEPLPGSIVAKVEAGEPLTADQRAFISGSGVPIYNFLLRVQDKPAPLRMVASAIEDPLVVDRTAIFADALFKAAADAFSGDHLAKPPRFDENQAALRAEFTQFMREQGTYIETVIELSELTERILAASPGFLFDR